MRSVTPTGSTRPPPKSPSRSGVTGPSANDVFVKPAPSPKRSPSKAAEKARFRIEGYSEDKDPYPPKTWLEQVIGKGPSVLGITGGVAMGVSSLAHLAQIPDAGVSSAVGSALAPLTILGALTGAWQNWRSLSRQQALQKDFLRSDTVKAHLTSLGKSENYKQLSQKEKNYLLEANGFGKRITWREKVGRIFLENIFPSIIGLISSSAVVAGSVGVGVLSLGLASPVSIAGGLVAGAVYLATSTAASWALKKFGDRIWSWRRPIIPERIFNRT